MPVPRVPKSWLIGTDKEQGKRQNPLHLAHSLWITAVRAVSQGHPKVPNETSGAFFETLHSASSLLWVPTSYHQILCCPLPHGLHGLSSLTRHSWSMVWLCACPAASLALATSSYPTITCLGSPVYLHILSNPGDASSSHTSDFVYFMNRRNCLCKSLKLMHVLACKDPLLPGSPTLFLKVCPMANRDGVCHCLLLFVPFLYRCPQKDLLLVQPPLMESEDELGCLLECAVGLALLHKPSLLPLSLACGSSQDLK